MIISEVLDAIDNINSITIESEIDTCKSLLSSYDKMSLLEEYYEGDDINGFKIFQEAQTESPKKNQGIFRTIINGIKTLFKAIAQWFQNIFNPQKVKQAEDNVKKCKKLGKKERAAIFGALGLATVTVASAAAVHHHKKNDNDEDNEQQSDSDKKTDEAVDDGDVKDNENQEADEEQNTNKLQLGKTDEQLKKALEKSNKKCIKYHKQLVQAFNAAVEAKNPFADKKGEFGWDNRKKGSSEARIYPCITYDRESNKVLFTYNVDFLIAMIKDLKDTSEKFISVCNNLINTINQNIDLTDENIDKILNKTKTKISTKLTLNSIPLEKPPISYSNIYLHVRAYSIDEAKKYDLEKIITNLKSEIKYEEFNNITHNYDDMLNKITSNDKIFDAISNNKELLRIFKRSTTRCEDLKNVIVPFLQLLNEAIIQYNMIISKINNRNQYISKIDLKMTENKTSVEKINNIDKTSNVDNTGEQPTYDKMVDKYEKWCKSSRKKPNKTEIDKKQEELIDEYKKKGLKFSGHIDRKKIFIDRDYTGLE